LTALSSRQLSQHEQADSKPDATTEAVRAVLREVLGLGQRADALNASTALLGDLPELDSMAVATVLTALEEKLGILIDDMDISAESFETFGNLVELVRSKAVAD
jgi:acyl carrier protein